MSHAAPIIVNRLVEAFDIYCGRPSVFGNMWVFGPDGTRDEVCDRYDTWLRTGRDFGHPAATEARRQEVLRRLPELAGKRIACYCAPRRCHLQTLAALLAELP